MNEMFVDCRTCPVRGRRCGDCMMQHLSPVPLGLPGLRPEHSLDANERRVLDMFERVGLVDEAGRADAQVEIVPVTRVRSVG